MIEDRDLESMEQQGDVLIKKLKSGKVPEGAKHVPAVGGRHILAEGEATGHAHAVSTSGLTQLFERDGQKFLKVSGDKPVTVRHEEHGPVEVEPGVHMIDIVQEYDYFAEEARNVAD